MIFSVSNLKSKFVNQIFNERLFMIVDSYDDFNYLEIVSKSQYLSHYYISYKIFNENKFFGSGFKSFRIESRKKEYQEKYLWSLYSSTPNSF